MDHDMQPYETFPFSGYRFFSIDAKYSETLIPLLNKPHICPALKNTDIKTTENSAPLNVGS
jgi:hypothetical protein